LSYHLIPRIRRSACMWKVGRTKAATNVLWW